MIQNTVIFQKIKDVLEQAPYGVGIYDIETAAPVFLNSAYYKLVGYTPAEHQKYAPDFTGLIFNEDLKISKQSFEEYHRSGAAAGYEYRIVRKDNQVLWVMLNVSTIEVDGKAYAFTSFTDVTKEHDASARISLVSENIGSSLSIIHVEKDKEELVYANDLFYKNIGIDKERYRANMPLYDRSFVSNEDHEKIKKMIADSLASGTAHELTHRFTHPDGTVSWYRRHFAAVRQDAPDTYLLISVVTDVTAEKEKELEAELEQRRFQAVIDELNAAVFEWDIKSNKFYTSEAYDRYTLSLDRIEAVLSNQGSLDCVHPQDIEKLYRFFEQTAAKKGKAEAILRLKMIDGGYRWQMLIILIQCSFAG